MQQNQITGIGEILWDKLPEGKQLGGAPLNCIYHAQQLGFEGAIVSSVGKDENGKEILEKIEDKNLTTEYIKNDPRHPTSTVEVELDEKGEAKYNIIEEVAWDYLDYNQKIENLSQNSEAVCFGTLAQRNKHSRKTIQKFLKQTSNECIVILDINLRQNYYNKQIIQKSLDSANVLKLNQDELSILIKFFDLTKQEDKALQILLDEFDLIMIALTKGKEGSKLLNRRHSSTLKPLDTKIEDTVGAGDSFTAAIVNGLIRGLPLQKIHQDANLLASFVCTQKGATPRIPQNILNKIG